MNRLLGLVFIIVTFSCWSGQKTNVKLIHRKYSHETIQSDKFHRYLIVKGKKLKSVEDKLVEFGELQAPGNKYTYKFGKLQFKDWTIIKFPPDFKDYYLYHNIVYWFLGYPPEDNNYADNVIGLSIDDESNVKYLIYNDYALKSKLNLADDLFGVFENNEKFALNIPFDTFKVISDTRVLDFGELQKRLQLDFNIVEKEKFVDFNVLFNEK